MLCLTRETGQSVTIGPDIRIVVLEITSGVVRLGFEAPKELAIHRDNIINKKPRDRN